MDLRARRFLRWTFIITFFLLAPVIILSTAGYRYNFGSHRLEKTGVIVVESRPAGASVSLNGKPQKPETPAHLPRITPGTYAVRVEKDGYHLWEKIISVNSRQTAFLNQIPLFRNEAPALMTELPATADTAFSPDARYAAAIASASSGAELVIVDTKTGQKMLPYRSSSDVAYFRLDWSRDGRRLLVRRETKKPGFLLWNASEPERVRDLATESDLPLTHVFWSQDSDRLYGVSQESLYALPADASPVLLGRAVAKPVVAGETLYGIAAGTPATLVSRKFSDQNFEPIAELPSADFTPIKGGEQRVVYASALGDRFFVIHVSGDRPTAFEGRGRSGVWSADGQQFLYWNDLEVRIYDAKNGSDDLLTRLSGPITQAAWHRPEWAALYSVGGNLYATEKDDRFGRVTTELAAFKQLARFAISRNGDIAYIYGTVGEAEGLWSLRLR